MRIDTSTFLVLFELDHQLSEVLHANGLAQLHHTEMSQTFSQGAPRFGIGARDRDVAVDELPLHQRRPLRQVGVWDDWATSPTCAVLWHEGLAIVGRRGGQKNAGWRMGAEGQFEAAEPAPPARQLESAVDAPEGAQLYQIQPSPGRVEANTTLPLRLPPSSALSAGCSFNLSASA